MTAFDHDSYDWELKLTAFRPEAYRYTRLAQVLQVAERAVHARGYATQWGGALRQLDDRKGDLTAVWRSDRDREQFASFIDSAWAETGEEEPPLHTLLSDQIEQLNRK